MASRTAEEKTIAPFVFIASFIAAGLATVLRLPGGVVLFLGLLLTSFSSVPPALTGAKSPTEQLPRNAAEQAKLLQHTMFARLKFFLFNPVHWLPWQSNTKPRLRISLLAWASFAVFALFATLPADALLSWGLLDTPHVALSMLNACTAYISVAALLNMFKTFASERDPKPSVYFSNLLDFCAKHNKEPFLYCVGAASIWIVISFISYTFIRVLGFEWFFVPEFVTHASLGAFFALMFLHKQASLDVMDMWKRQVGARLVWDERWAALRIAPAPTLESHAEYQVEGVGYVICDTFLASAGLGASGALALGKKIKTAIGSGMCVAVLREENLDYANVPIPGTVHPTKFSVVCVPVTVSRGEEVLDVRNPSIEHDLLRLLLRFAVASATEEAGCDQAMLIDLQASHTLDSTRAVWKTLWQAPGNIDTLCVMISPRVGVHLGCSAVADTSEPGVIYVGQIDGDQTTFQNENLQQRFQALHNEHLWDIRWSDVLKMGEQRPWIQHEVFAESTLSDLAVLYRQPFMTSQGVSATDYITREKERKLATVLQNAPFVSVSGWIGDPSRPGVRHPGAFQVIWSATAVPISPAELTPSNADGVGWVLSAMVNSAFDATKLPRGEIVSFRPLTLPRSISHVWEVVVRLYGGVTSALVKKSVEKMRSATGGTSLFYVTEHESGVRIIFGDAKDVLFVNKKAKEAVLALEWEQIFLDAKLDSAIDGGVPQLISSSVLPHNETIKVLTFSMPRGLSVSDFSAPKTLDKLRSGASKEFINVREGKNPAEVILLVCDADPMPKIAPFVFQDLNKINARRVPFGTSTQGTYAVWDLDLDSHLLVLGQNGSGKGIAMSVLLTGALSRGWEVYAADPVKGFNDFLFADDFLQYRATSYEDSLAVVQKLVSILDERKELNAKYSVTNIKDLPETVRPPIVCLFVDEFTSLVLPDPANKPNSGASMEQRLMCAQAEAINTSKSVIAVGIGRILREGRAAGIAVVLAGQKLTNEILARIPGGQTIKSQMSRLAMGKMSFSDMVCAFADASSAQGLLGSSVPRGRGVFESTAQSAFAIQAWWAGGSPPEHFQAMQDHIRNVRKPLTQKFDPHPFLPSVQTRVLGRKVEEKPDEIIDMGVVDMTRIDFEDELTNTAQPLVRGDLP